MIWCCVGTFMLGIISGIYITAKAYENKDNQENKDKGEENGNESKH